MAAICWIFAGLPSVDAASSIQPGTDWLDNNGNPVDAHGGGIWHENGKFYVYGEYFSGGTNDFKAVSMYSSTDLMTWTFEKQVLPVQASGELGPNRVGERPHIIKCPGTGEYVMFIHAADITYQSDKEIVYATCATINGNYTYQGPIKNSSGTLIAHSDFTAFQDGASGYICTESGYIYTLSADYHSWVSVTQGSAMSGKESPTIIKNNGTFYWLWSNKTGWKSNDNGYATATSMTGTWTSRGLVAPAGTFTWNSQCTYVLPVTGTAGTTFLYWGDRWYSPDNAKATYVWLPLTINGNTVSLPSFYPSWTINIGAGTWSGSATSVPSGTNLALSKVASTDSAQSGNPASNGNDSSTTTRWSAANSSTGHWWEVDLGAVKNITGFQIMWEKSGLAYQYRIDVSNNNSTWTLADDKASNPSTTQTQTIFKNITGRYVRITVTGLATGAWASFYDFKVYGN